MRKKTLLILVTILLFITGCSNKSKENINKDGDVVVTGDDVKGVEKVPVVDGKETQLTVLSAPIEESFYFSQLPRTLDDSIIQIKEAITNFDPVVKLNRPIEENDAKKIMNIIFLDEPDFLYLKPEVGFDLTDDNKVHSISFNYLIGQNDYEEYKNMVLDKIGIPHKGVKVNAYDLFVDVTDRGVFKKVDYCLNSELFDNGCLNAQDIARTRAYALRNAGIETVIVYGENVSSEFKQQGLFLPEFKDAKINYKSKNKKATYSVDVSNMYSWLMVKINHHYYHYDVLYNALVADTIALNLGGEFDGFTLVDDTVASNYLLSFYSESLLGVTPSAESDQFTWSFRNDQYLKKVSEQQLIKFTQDLIEDELSKVSSWEIQFEDAGNFNHFLSTIDNQISIYNKDNLPQITDYVIDVVPDALYVYIHSIKK